MSAKWQEAERQANAERVRALIEAADPECRICRGGGQTKNWVAQGFVSKACPCTGQAEWQRAGVPATP